jgi:hypothetical protein
MQVERIGFHTVELSICGSDLGLSLVEIGLCARLAIELLDLVALHIK